MLITNKAADMQTFRPATNDFCCCSRPPGFVLAQIKCVVLCRVASCFVRHVLMCAVMVCVFNPRKCGLGLVRVGVEC